MRSGFWWKKMASSLTLAFLAGCAIGNGQICGPQTPAAYCDSNAYKQLTQPPPLRDSWVGSSLQSRAQDWVHCGGSSDGWFDVQTNDPSGNDYNQKAKEKSHSIQRCMLKNGYRYTGQCDSSVMKQAPACLDNPPAKTTQSGVGFSR